MYVQGARGIADRAEFSNEMAKNETAKIEGVFARIKPAIF